MANASIKFLLNCVACVCCRHLVDLFVQCKRSIDVTGRSRQMNRVSLCNCVSITFIGAVLEVDTPADLKQSMKTFRSNEALFASKISFGLYLDLAIVSAAP
jgi:hypothetical protein